MIKLIYMRKVLKRIEIIKQVSVALFFGSLLFTFIVPVQLSYYIKQVIIVCILIVLNCEFIKLAKIAIVFLLTFLKDKRKEP